MVRYSGLSPDGRASWQLTVASGGEAQGTLELGDGKLAVLEVGGRTYFKAADPASVGLLGELPSGVTATSARGKWVTGDGALEALLPSGLASAGNLAVSLRSALPSQDVGFPSSTAPSTSVDGDPAVPVSTAAGVLYISTEQPYRVLRLIPPATGSGAPTDVEPLSQSAATPLFGSLVDQTKTLTGALDFGVVFQHGQDSKLYCSDDQCQVEVSGVVASAADPSTDPSGDSPADPNGTVVADVTATVSVDGQPAGQCEVTAELPFDRPEKFTCQDPDAAPVVQSLGGGGGLSVAVDLSFLARADTQADVDALVAAEQNLLLDRGGATHSELG